MDLNQPIELRATNVKSLGNVSVEEKRFSMVPYEGQVIEWMGDRLVVDVATVKLRKDVIPAFVDHDPARMAGEIDGMSTQGNKITLSGEFIDTPHAGEIQAKKKLEYECSMKFNPSHSTVTEVEEGETIEANGQTYEGPLYFMQNTPLMESSFTYYGAVNGASAEFSKESNKQEVSMQGQGKGGESPQKSAQDVLSEMVELSGDKAFATDCFLKGMGTEEFKDRLNVSLSEKNIALNETVVELTKENDELKSEIVELKKVNDDALHAGTGAGQKELDFIQLSQKYAKDHGVALSEAMKTVAYEQPEVYAKQTGRYV